MDFLHKQNTYDTPESNKRVLMDKLFLGSNIFFMYQYFKQVLKAASLAKKNLYTKEEWEKSSFQTIKNVEMCGGSVHINNLDNLKKAEGPVVLVGNHMSVLETFLLPCLISPVHTVTYIVKKSLVEHPIFGPVMSSRNPITVERTNPREDFQKVLKEGKTILKNGTSIIVFPQSTRDNKFIPENFNTLGIKLAKSAKVKVIPIALKTDFWPNGKILKDFGPIIRDRPVYVNFGDPMEITGNGKNEHAKIVDFIQENLNNWNNN